MNPKVDPVLPRRGLVGALLASGAAGLAAAADTHVSLDSRAESARNQQVREALRQRRTPNLPLLDQDGRALRFYDDVMKGRKVLLSVMYSICSNVCTPATQNLKEARRLLGKQADGLHFVSLTLTPLTDTPAVLKAYKKLHGLDDNWTFLTGTPDNMDQLHRALGFIGDDETDSLLDHAAMARLCDERYLRWTHINTLVPPRSIARMIRFELA